MAKTKLKLFAIAIMAITITLLSQESQAYYSTIGRATNVVTSGNISFQIHERTSQGTEFPKEGVYIMPGDVVSKQVSIENICEHPFYIRVKILYDVDSKELPSEECFSLNINKKHWVEHDGWFYYNGMVEPGETTPLVFSEVEIVGEKVDNDYLGKTLSLTVKAHAVQSEHNPVEHPWEASGWPAEEGVK